MFHDITKENKYDTFLYDRRNNSLLDQIYQTKPVKKDDNDPDSYEYKIFKYKYDFEY